MWKTCIVPLVLRNQFKQSLNIVARASLAHLEIFDDACSAHIKSNCREIKMIWMLVAFTCFKSRRSGKLLTCIPWTLSTRMRHCVYIHDLYGSTANRNHWVACLYLRINWHVWQHGMHASIRVWLPWWCAYFIAPVQPTHVHMRFF